MRNILFSASLATLICHSANALTLSCDNHDFEDYIDQDFLETVRIEKKASIDGLPMVLFSSGYAGTYCTNGRDYGLIINDGRYNTILLCGKKNDVQFTQKGNRIDVTFKEGKRKIRYPLKDGKYTCNKV